MSRILHFQYTCALATIIVLNCFYNDLKSQNSYDSQNLTNYSDYSNKQISPSENNNHKNLQNLYSHDLISSELDYCKGGIYDGRKPEDEIVSLRDETSKHFRNANGTYDAIITAGSPLNYLENGIWKTVRKEILPNTTAHFNNYDYANITNTQKTFYSDNSNGGLIIENNGYLIEEWINPEIAWIVDSNQISNLSVADSDAEVNLNVLTYQNSFPGIDVRFTQNNGGKKLDLIIKDNSIFSSIPEGAEYLAFNETIILPDGWSYKLDELSCLKIYNNYGECVFVYLAPEYYDSNSATGTSFGKYTIENNNNELRISTLIPVEWLTSTERVFPLIIDPTTQIYAFQGGYQTADGNYNDNSYNNYTGWNGIVLYHGYAKFNTSSINDNFIINNANLTLYCNGGYDNNPETVRTYSIETYYGPYFAYNINYFNELADGDLYSMDVVDILNAYHGPSTLSGAEAHIKAQLPNDRFQIGFLITLDWKKFGPESYISINYTTAFSITNFSPLKTCFNSGTSITIEGYEFTGATQVQINGTDAAFTVVDDNTITTTLPNGATSGYISVTTPAGTETSLYTLMVKSLPTEPNPVTASPSTICSGGTSNLNAISDGSTINWYTEASGGTSIGSSNSGDNFPVNPISTTTYYAESQSINNKYYINSNIGILWPGAENDPINAMNTVFGAGNWIHEYFETVNISELLSPNTSFIYLEGSCMGATELEAFLTAHITEIENWVNNGGNLLLKSAPNEDNGMSFGFGGTILFLSGNTPSTFGNSIDNSHPIFNGPYMPCGVSFTGGSFSHAAITGTGLTNLIIGNLDYISLAEKDWGVGKVVFSGMTLPYWWNPDPNSYNLLQNIISYLGFYPNCISENRTPVTVTVVDDPTLSDPIFSDDNICVSFSTSISSTLTGGTEMAFLWEYSSDNIIWNTVNDNTPSGAIYTDQTTETLSISGINAEGTYYYRLSATSTGEGCNTPVYSNSAMLTVVFDDENPSASNPNPISIECISDLPTPDISVVTDEADNIATNPTVEWIEDISDNNYCPEIITRYYKISDNCLNNITVTQEITIIPTTAPIVPANESFTVECIADAVAPSTPIVTDVCGISLTPVFESMTDNPEPLECEGTRTYRYSYTDCASNVSYWEYTYTIEREDFTMPADDGNTVACIADAVEPTPPVVNDDCGNAITPSAPVISGDYNGCESTHIYTFTYTDCEGNTHDWIYTYTVEREDFTMPDDDGSTVACIADAVEPTPPIVTDNCSNAITPSAPVISGDYDGCEGTHIYTFTYTDCEGNSHDWIYTYTVEREDFTMPADDGSTVACIADAVEPTPPVVTD
ncbi:MAG: IPT/TIG domain-containing protein, partial [Bacteroidales bacterium]|nr:IPT/TIG domain-containing protein [Bacteroidales bacterium]